MVEENKKKKAHFPIGTAVHSWNYRSSSAESAHISSSWSYPRGNSIVMFSFYFQFFRLDLPLATARHISGPGKETHHVLIYRRA